MIPTFTDNRQSKRDLIQRMRDYNVKMTELSKETVGEMHTGNIEGLLQNFSMLMVGEYDGKETIEIPVDVIRETALFSIVTLSRLLHDRYKLEKALGRPVVDTPFEEPSLTDLEEVLEDIKEENLTEDVLPVMIKEEGDTK